jgi:YidC/Oxa1 family membrane protein insertase
MGVTMFVQQKLSPAPPDPIQAKVMMALPIVFTFMFLWFPAGLVLYWVVNNMLSIAQQYVITKRVEAGVDIPAKSGDSFLAKQTSKLVDLAKKQFVKPPPRRKGK